MVKLSQKSVALLFLTLIVPMVHAGACEHTIERNSPGFSELEKGFKTPPDSVKPSLCWYWINDNISLDGVNCDLKAMAYLGKVYLSMAGLSLQKTGHYQKTADKLQEVVNSGLYSLLPDYGAVFAPANEANEEIIFARPNIRETFNETVLTFFANPPNSPFAFAGGQYPFALTESFYNSYDPDNERRDVAMMGTYTDRNERQVTYNDPNNPEDLFFGGYSDPNGIALDKYKESNNSQDPFAHDNKAKLRPTKI